MFCRVLRFRVLQSKPDYLFRGRPTVSAFSFSLPSISNICSSSPSFIHYFFSSLSESSSTSSKDDDEGEYISIAVDRSGLKLPMSADMIQPEGTVDKREEITPLARELVDQITATGPVTIADFMRRVSFKLHVFFYYFIYILFVCFV